MNLIRKKRGKPARRGGKAGRRALQAQATEIRAILGLIRMMRKIQAITVGQNRVPDGEVILRRTPAQEGKVIKIPESEGVD